MDREDDCRNTSAEPLGRDGDDACEVSGIVSNTVLLSGEPFDWSSARELQFTCG